MRYTCCDDRRLRAVKEAGVLNGIEYVEVSDSDAPTKALRQRTLFVRLLQPAPGLTPETNVEITGGERIPTVAPSTPPAAEVPALTAGLDDPSTVMLVRTDSTGDFSTYTLRLVAGGASGQPPAGFDPMLVSVEFSFKVECPSDFDCAPACDCEPEVVEQPSIDYLAKDYDSFRGLMLDRLSLIAPDWTERTPADTGIALVELLAYVADELSYRQDAVATEAYLGTARRRTSLRRHARLVDYTVHEGANARVWVRVFAGGEGVALERGTALLTRVPDVPAVVEPGGPDYRAALAAGAETFETLEDAVLYASHDRFDFWTWGGAGCCLPRGGTSATLLGDHPQLKAGDVLVLAEVAGPVTGRPEDADPAKRAAVRLTSVVPSVDPSGGLFADPPTNASVAITEIEWDEADALAFPLCISVEEHPDLVVGEAWGNVVLADHGRTIDAEPLGEVPPPVLTAVEPEGCDPCEHEEPEPVPIRFRPTLAGAPVTQVRPGPLGGGRAGRSDACARGRPRVAHVQPASPQLARRARLRVHRRPRGRPRRRRRLVGERRLHRRGPAGGRRHADRVCPSGGGHDDDRRRPGRGRPGRHARGDASRGDRAVDAPSRSARVGRRRYRVRSRGRDGRHCDAAVRRQCPRAASRDGHVVHRDLPRRQRRRGKRRRRLDRARGDAERGDPRRDRTRSRQPAAPTRRRPTRSVATRRRPTACRSAR